VADELNNFGSNWLGEEVGELYGNLLSSLVVLVEAEED
jgi:hypothetical protein